MEIDSSGAAIFDINFTLDPWRFVAQKQLVAARGTQRRDCDTWKVCDALWQFVTITHARIVLSRFLMLSSWTPPTWSFPNSLWTTLSRLGAIAMIHSLFNQLWRWNVAGQQHTGPYQSDHFEVSCDHLNSFVLRCSCRMWVWLLLPIWISLIAFLL